MVNRVVLVGRITRDPELKYTQTNIPVVSFTVAVNRNYVNQQGEREADFINCVAWRGQAENISRFVKKGLLIGIDGRLQTRTYQTATGENRYVTEVVCDSVAFLESRASTQEFVDDNEDPLIESDIDIASEDDLPF